MAFYLIKGDLVTMNVDCIVSNANVNLKMVEGVTRAIFHKAGDIDMMEACRKYGRCEVGKAVITPSFKIDTCKAVIHAVGPNYINGKHGEEKNLRSAYQSVFDIMKENKFTSVAFPLLSSDFNYPLDECYAIAKDVILKNIKENPKLEVYMVFFKNIFPLASNELRDEINLSLMRDNKIFDIQVLNSDTNLEGVNFIDKKEQELEINDEEVSFRGNLEDGYIQRFRNDQTYIPSKNALYGIGIALHLKNEEFLKLLGLFGYSVQFNTVKLATINYFLEKNANDVYLLNDCLFDLSLQAINSK